MRINPVLRNESKISCRSFKFYAMILFYILLLIVPILFLYFSSVGDGYYYGISPDEFTLIYFMMTCVQAVLLMFIVPALSAPTITSEREKETLDILLSTKMSPLSIIIGKLLASTSKVILLILCTIPVYSIGFLLGGISFIHIIQINLYFIVTTLFVASIGVFISCCVKSTKTSNILTYIVILTIIIGTLVLLVAITFIYLKITGNNSMKDLNLPFWLYINPALGFSNLLFNQLGALGPLEFFSALPSGSGSWIISIIVQLVLTTIIIFSAAYVLNPLNKKNRLKKLFKFKRKKVS